MHRYRSRLQLPVVLLVAFIGCNGGELDAGPDATNEAGADGDVVLDAGGTDADVVEGGVDADDAQNDADLSSDADAGPRDGDPDEIDTGRDADEDVGPEEPLRIYLAPDGDDAREGLTVATSILTLSRAHEIIVASSLDRDVEVRIAAGRYFEQQVEWTVTMPDHVIRFMTLLEDHDRPVFDGCRIESPADPESDCLGGTWFRLRHSAGEETNLHFEYIRVENYGTAISLNGSRGDEVDSNGSNRIYGCFFYNIGNVFNTSLDPSTAAVRLVNSDDNEVANNHFVNVINTTSEGLIHCLYVAHMSDRNQILRNRFQSSTGDPVRIRDFSNDNEVADNRFIQTGVNAGYTDWYCDHEVRTDCTKPEPECPSWGNWFRNNSLDGTWGCERLSTWHLFQDDETAGCSPPSPEAQRVRTAGNEHTDTPCEGL